MKQAEEASFVDLIACERDCRYLQLRRGARLRRQLRRLPAQPLLPLREPRRRPEQDGAAAHRAAPDPAPGSAGPELGGSRPPSGTWPNGSGRPRGIFDLEAKEARVAEIEALTQEPGFWDDGRAAQKVLREADGLRDARSPRGASCSTRADDLLAAVELLYEAPDAELEAELERDAASLETDFLRERTALLFAGEYDERPALLSISAGAGGTEATDWTEMLLRMYLRWAERHRFPTEILDQQEGEQAGLKSVTVAVDGRRAYGWLRAERGVHRLVRISPFDSQNRRQTTFALVEVLPEADDDVEIELDWDQIRVDTFRSQGAGGQHVNKTDSAVRLTHLPTGIVAQSQNERSQTQNKEMAIKVLKSRLLERALEEKEEEVRKLKGEHVEAGWGNQIRSYVLHPYQMVKDLRTGYETGQHRGRPRRRPRRVHAGRARARHRRGGAPRECARPGARETPCRS